MGEKKKIYEVFVKRNDEDLPHKLKSTIFNTKKRAIAEAIRINQFFGYESHNIQIVEYVCEPNVKETLSEIMTEMNNEKKNK